MRNKNVTGGTTPTTNVIGATPTKTTRGRTRGRQRFAATRNLTNGGTTVDAIMRQWNDAGLVDPAEIAAARKYVGLTLITLGVTHT